MVRLHKLQSLESRAFVVNVVHHKAEIDSLNLLLVEVQADAAFRSTTEAVRHD
jgi:hypothetical protein